MKKYLIISILIIASMSTEAQEILFLGEGMKDEVRLFWIPLKAWGQDLDGFNIKRKTNEENSWKRLNSSVIMPGTNQEKSLNNIGFSAADVQDLQLERSQLINAGILNSIPSGKFIDLMKDTNTLEGISIMLNSNFNVALISGFGYVDKGIPKAHKYTYGLFPVYNGSESENPISIFNWEYASAPAIELAMEGRIQNIDNRKGVVKLTWKLNTDEYKKYPTLNGFNIYRKSGNEAYVKLNQHPIWISLKDKEAILYFKDEHIDLEKKYTYAAAPNTIFNTSGSYSEIEVEVVKTPENLATPVQSNPKKDGDSLLIAWTFPFSQQSFIKGFYVQMEGNKSKRFSNISALLPSSARAFVYSSLASSDDKFYHFKIVAITNDDLELWSNRKIYYNKRITKPSAPENLQAEVVTSETDTQVRLTWEPPAKNAEFVKEYYLYTSSPNNNRLVKEGSLETITKETYFYPVFRERAANYNFAVSAVNDQNEESFLSETISILVPSRSLPFIDIWPISKEGNEVTLNWKYDDDIADLAGFRLFQNDELIADENRLDAESRQWKSAELEPGQYSYEIIAVTLTDVQSERSKERKFNIE